MKRYLYILLVIVVFALQACGGASSEPADDGSGLIPPVVSNDTSSGAEGSAGAITKMATVPALCASGDDANTDSFAAEVIRLVNVERAKVNGLSPLTANAKLGNAAQKHAIDMACRVPSFLSHTGSDGSYINDRMTAFGYAYNWWGENVARGQITPTKVMIAFMNSTAHRENILKADYTEIGVGYVYNSTDAYKHYWAMSLGSPE